MLFRNIPVKIDNDIIYIPKHKIIPAQDSQQCYYFSFLHLLAMHGNKITTPPCVIKMVEAIKYDPDRDREIMIGIMTSHADDITYIYDEILDSEDSNYEGDWVEDTVDKYGVDFTMAKLLHLNITEFESENICKYTLVIQQLKNILRTHGPIAIGLIRGNDLTDIQLPPTETITSSKEATKWDIFNVDNYPADIPHCVLLIGCSEKQNSVQQVYFIDPNYPEMILSMNFKLFKENILMPEFAHINENMLKPDRVTFSATNDTKRHKSNHNETKHAEHITLSHLSR